MKREVIVHFSKDDKDLLKTITKMLTNISCAEYHVMNAGSKIRMIIA